MPKREKTPSPGPDEPKFLSIYYPFPLYVTLEEERETIHCAKWLSCFIGKDNLYAMFHKPKSPNVIIIEISNELTDEKMRTILGEHDWDQIFKKFDREEGFTKSQIFYSTFRTRREVEKTGWKIVEVKDEWFDGFNPQKNSQVVAKYPLTKFCEPPDFAEESSGALRLFRYLPADLFPEARGRVDTTVKAAAPQPTPPPRTVPGSGGLPGAGPTNAGGKGKKKKVKAKADGNAAADPTIRPTGPLARPAEASAKSKVIHKQSNQVTVNVYDDDSDDDREYYQAQIDDPEPDEAGENSNEPVEKIEEAMQKAKISGATQAQEYHPLVFDKPNAEVDESEICPTHKKRCKPGICEWASNQKRLKKQLQNRTGGRAGQNQRRW